MRTEPFAGLPFEDPSRVPDRHVRLLRHFVKTQRRVSKTRANRSQSRRESDFGCVGAMLFAMRCATAIPQETDQTRAPGIGQRVRYREDREHRRDFAIRMNPTCAFESPDQIAHDGIHQQLISAGAPTARSRTTARTSVRSKVGSAEMKRREDPTKLQQLDSVEGLRMSF